MPKGSCWEAFYRREKGTHERGRIDAGMSGSGVFDRQGRLLGILAGGDGREGFAAVPVWKFAGKQGQAVS